VNLTFLRVQILLSLIFICIGVHCVWAIWEWHKNKEVPGLLLVVSLIWSILASGGIATAAGLLGAAISYALTDELPLTAEMMGSLKELMFPAIIALSLTIAAGVFGAYTVFGFFKKKLGL
jgi:hypothetical protein